jgi:hypothetical protein
MVKGVECLRTFFFFFLKRGIRQGDSLSLFLFIMAISFIRKRRKMQERCDNLVQEIPIKNAYNLFFSTIYLKSNQ